MKLKDHPCPSPENPCMCYCHISGAKDGTMQGWCWDCRTGRHKPKRKDN